MQITETNSEGLNRGFAIVVPAADLEAKVDERLKEVGQQVKIPGFRPGKVPMGILRSRFAKSVMGEVLEQTVSETTASTLEEREIRPALQPKIEITSFDEGGDLEFKVDVEMMPEVSPMDFSKLSIEKLIVDVPEKELDEALQSVAERSKRAEPLKRKRAAKNGDVTVIDFDGEVDGKRLPQLKAEGFSLELGSGSFVEGFEEQLIGAKEGDEKTVTVTFPESYGGAEVAGKEVAFDVKVNEVKELVTPELNDELATTLGLENLDALKERVKEDLGREYENVTRSVMKRKILDQLHDNHDFEVPAGLVDMEFDSIWQQIERDKEAGNLDEDDAAKDEDVLKSDYRDIAVRRVRLGLLLSDVGQKNDLQVSEQEISMAAMQEAQRYPGQEGEVMKYFRENPEAMAQLRAPILEEKTIDYLVELASVTERSISPDDLKAELEALEDGDSSKKKKPAAKKKAAPKKKAAAADEEKPAKAAKSKAKKKED
jgi:trigger factor